MTSQVDSAAYFSQRAAEVSLTTRVTTALQDAGLKTLSQLAFCVGQPGQLLPQTDFDKVRKRLLGALSWSLKLCWWLHLKT